MRHGTLVHRLLQSLPDIAAGRRRGEAALAYLARDADGWSEEERQAIGANQHAGPDRGYAFRARVRPRQPGRSLDRRAAGAAGRTAGAGIRTVDHLVVTESEVLIVDFKTNHTPPGRPEGRRRGAMSASSPCTGRCWASFIPQLPVRAALLWPGPAELMEISAPALEAELASIISA